MGKLTLASLASRAAELTQQFGLAKKTLTMLKDGSAVGSRGVDHPDVCAFCMIGFLQRSAYDQIGSDRSKWASEDHTTYYRALNHPLVDVEWSDSPETTISDVRQRFEVMASPV